MSLKAEETLWVSDSFLKLTLELKNIRAIGYLWESAWS